MCIRDRIISDYHGIVILDGHREYQYPNDQEHKRIRAVFFSVLQPITLAPQHRIPVQDVRHPTGTTSTPSLRLYAQLPDAVSTIRNEGCGMQEVSILAANFCSIVALCSIAS